MSLRTVACLWSAAQLPGGVGMETVRRKREGRWNGQQHRHRGFNAKAGRLPFEATGQCCSQAFFELQNVRARPQFSQQARAIGGASSLQNKAAQGHE